MLLLGKLSIGCSKNSNKFKNKQTNVSLRKNQQYLVFKEYKVFRNLIYYLVLKSTIKYKINNFMKLINLVTMRTRIVRISICIRLSKNI